MWQLLILYLASLALRSVVLAVLAGLIATRMRSVASRHAVWVVVLGCMLLMPVADFLLPASLIPTRVPELVLPVQTFVVAPAVESISFPAFLPAIPEPPRRDWWQIGALIWMSVSAVLLFRLAVACIAVVRIKRDCRNVSEEFEFRRPAIRESGQVTIPLTVGLWEPVLILPLGWRDWDDWKLRAVLTHELAHVRRRDWAIALTATLARCVFWFNPLSWWLERHLASLAEQASDEACVQATGDAPRYAETLLQFASVAKHGRRWIGGVAMAQYKISARIERVLRLQQAGSGVLSRAGWIAVCLLAVPALYGAAAVQSLTRTEMPALSPAEILRVVQQQLPAPAPATVAPVPAPQQPLPVAPASPAPQAPTPAPLPTPATQTPFGTAVPFNPDLVGEIKLILAPVDQAPGTSPGQVQLETNQGNVIWRLRNNALAPNLWAANSTWKTYSFAMTGVQGRTAFFETREGGTFSYGCANCSFLASELGVSGVSASGVSGIVFHLKDDGKFATATCRASECRVGRPSMQQTLKNGETMEFSLPQPAPANFNAPGLQCFSVFGNVKADGTRFTGAECLAQASAIFFSVTP
jgi:beta-lactamase regulating signal transducer with metallopeptidase domain